MAGKAGPDISEVGLVGYWDAANVKSYPGSGTIWRDLSGNGNHGTLSTGSIGTVSGSGVMAFDGVDDYVNASDADMPAGNSSRTFEAWIKMASDTDNWTSGLSYGTQTNDSASLWSLTDASGTGKPYFGKWGLNSGTADTAVDDSIWHQIVMVLTQDGANDIDLSFYIDGIVDGTTTLADVNTTLGGDFNIGCRPGADDYWFKGNISLVKVYNKALSQSEITQNYNAMKSRYQ